VTKRNKHSQTMHGTDEQAHPRHVWDTLSVGPVDSAWDTSGDYRGLSAVDRVGHIGHCL